MTGRNVYRLGVAACFVAMIVTMCVACEPASPIVSVKTSPAITVESTVACNHPGYCMTCSPMGGCGFKYHLSCSGTRAATVSRSMVTRTYANGKVVTRPVDQVIAIHGACT